MISDTEACDGCYAVLPRVDGPRHRYIGASAACWDIYTKLLAGVPAVQQTSFQPLVIDAYAAQHPGDDSPQATQSAAIHLVTLEVILESGVGLEHAVAVRTEVVSMGREGDGFPKLDPPQAYELTVSDIAAETDPKRRGAVMDRYVETVWSVWNELHAEQISEWSLAVTTRLRL